MNFGGIFVIITLERIDIVKKTLYMLVGLLLLLTTACGNPKLKNGEDVVAQINGKKYTADELYEELKGQYGYQILINMIDYEIADREVKTTDELEKNAKEIAESISSVAEAYGYDLATYLQMQYQITNVTTKEELIDFVLRDQKLSLAIENHVAEKVTNKEAKDYYDENYKTVFTYREILLSDNDDAEKTIKTIKDALKGKSGDDLVEAFAEQAKEYSEADSKDNGGLVEDATKNTVPEKVWDELNDLKKDKTYSSNEISTDAGIYLVLRVSKDKGKDFEEVKDEICSLIAQDKLTNDAALSYDTLTELRNKYKIVFKDKVLKDEYDNYLKELEDYKKSLEESAENEEEDD